jgi:cytochrome P450
MASTSASARRSRVLEARTALGDLLGAIKGFELARTDWEPRRAFHVHGPSSLPIRFDRA